MKKLIITLIVLQLIIVGLVSMGKKFTLSINRQKAPMTVQEIVLECEKLSAMATNENWNYKNCIDNLKNPNEAKILRI